MIFTPHRYQHDAIAFGAHRFLCHGCFGAGLFLDPGLGKTSITLATIRMLMMLAGLRKVLVVAPLRVCYNVWPAEIAKWDQFRGLRVSIIHGDESERLQALYADADIYIINVDGVRWLTQHLIATGLAQLDQTAVIRAFKRMKLPDFAARIEYGEHPAGVIDQLKPERYDTLMKNVGGLLISRWGMIVVDESSLFKTPGARRTRCLVSLTQQTRYRSILTGTPIPRSLEDIYSQVYLLDNGAALGPNPTQFRKRWFERLDQNRGYIVRDRQAEEEIKQLVAPLCLRMDAESHLDIPPIVYNEMWIDLPPESRRVYNRLEQEMFLELDRGGIQTVENEGSKYNACRGVANGAFYDSQTGQRVTNYVHERKTQALLELIRELQGKPLLVAYQFQHDVERIVDAFKRWKLPPPVVLMGTGEAEIDAWNKGQIVVLLVQSSRIAYGVNMQFGGLDIAWYGLTNNLDHYAQFNDRVHRQGVRGTVRVHHLLCRNTVEEAMLFSIRRKCRTQAEFLGALHAYRTGMRVNPREMYLAA